jgi:cytoskeletal protein CcmA (bactofilin family)
VGFSAVIKGRVRARSIAIARGAIIEGEMQVTGSAAPIHFLEKRAEK